MAEYGALSRASCTFTYPSQALRAIVRRSGVLRRVSARSHILGKTSEHMCAGEWLVIVDELLDMFDVRREIMHGSSSTSFGGRQMDTGRLQAQSSAHRSACPMSLAWHRCLFTTIGLLTGMQA